MQELQDYFIREKLDEWDRLWIMARSEQLQIATHWFSKKSKPPTIMEMYEELAPDDPRIGRHYKKVNAEQEAARAAMYDAKAVAAREERWSKAAGKKLTIKVPEEFRE